MRTLIVGTDHKISEGSILRLCDDPVRAASTRLDESRQDGTLVIWADIWARLARAAWYI